MNIRITSSVLYLLSAVSCLALYLPEGEFTKRTKLYPKSQVLLDLRDPFNYSGIPKDEKWFQMGSYEFCAIEGATTAEIILPNGRVILEEFSIVYIHRDHQGIYEVRADSSGWLDEENALKRLDWQLQWFSKQKYEIEVLEERKTHLVNWIKNYDHQMETYESIWVKDAEHSLYFRFFNIGGIRYCYDYRIERSKERRRNNLFKRP
tara:strand:+ start:73 stop:690 length:618 start_codon:yes stop_codon:yes gene_type:complete